MDLKKKTDDELKVMVYDKSLARDILNNDIQQILVELQQRESKPKPVK